MSMTIIYSLGSRRVHRDIKHLAAKPTLSALWNVNGLAAEYKTTTAIAAA
jgi:hypothetical protein